MFEISFRLSFDLFFRPTTMTNTPNNGCRTEVSHGRQLKFADLDINKISISAEFCLSLYDFWNKVYQIRIIECDTIILKQPKTRL